MSDSKNTFPFPTTGAEGALDIGAIFGNNTPGGDVNPFDAPAEQEPVGQTPGPAESKPAAEPETQQAAETPTKQTDPAPAPDAKAQPEEAPPAEEPNPISAAFTKQEEKNTQKGLLEKDPVFCYGSAKEPVSDSSMTFEELRIAKSDDFPELSEGKRVSWTVEYGKVVKPISDPKGTTISSVKKEIEQSKAFLDGLKKAKDKCPDCLVKPKVTAQSKGIAPYKGVFGSLEKARASDKTICLIPARDGRVYELRKNALGEFIAPKDNVVEFEQIRAGFTPALPLIPQSLLRQVISFFRCYMHEGEEFEAMVHILWDVEREEFTVHIPEQSVSKARIDADLRGDALPEGRYLHYADIHSHNSMEAKFSAVDDQDEKATRLYVVVGCLDSFFPEISVRMSCGGVYQALDPAEVFEGIGEPFPSHWQEHVRVQRCPQRHMRSVESRLAGHFWEGEQ